MNLRALAKYKEPHVLRFVAAFRQGEGRKMIHYLISEWADGGSLRDIWYRNKQPVLDRGLVKDTITQLLGLAEALYHIHYPRPRGGGIVHGDLKPENILSVSGEGLMGILKIGDWGLVKEKHIKTRDQQTASIYRSSIKYEPPEMSEGVLVEGRSRFVKIRSRLYDVWSMGCIILEFIIWLVQGTQILDRLHSNIGISQFWEPSGLHGATYPRIRASIVQAMDDLAKEPACNGATALGELLELVRTRLLVVHLPKRLAALEDEDEEKVENKFTREMKIGHPWIDDEDSDEEAGSRVVDDLPKDQVATRQDDSVKSEFELGQRSRSYSIGSQHSASTAEDPHAEKAEWISDSDSSSDGSSSSVSDGSLDIGIHEPENLPPEAPRIEITSADHGDPSSTSTREKEPRQLPRGPPRATSIELYHTLQEISAKGNREASYWLEDISAG